MANTGQCVVLCIEVDGSAAVPTDDLECRLQTVRMPRDSISEVLYELTNGVVSFVLLVSEFWILEDLYQW